MRCIDGAVAIDGQHAHAAERAAMVIHLHHCPAKTLVADIDLVLLLFGLGFLHLFFNPSQKFLAVQERLKIHRALLQERRLII